MASIRQLRSGNWNAQVRKAGCKPISKTFKTEVEARRWAFELEQEVTAGVARHDHTLQTIKEPYLQTQEGRGGYDAAVLRLRHLEAFFGSMALRSISPHDLERYKRKRGEKVSPSTVRLELQLLSRLFKFTRRRFHAELTDVFQYVELPKANPPRDRLITRVELFRIVNDLPPLMADVVRIAYETAMRRSEITRLTPEDIDLDNKQLLVRQAKNGHPRLVPLNTNARGILAKAIEGKSKGDCLFPVEPKSVTRAFKRACHRLKIEGLCFHSLRHSAITRYAERGLSAAQLQVVSGHRDIKMLARYLHMKPQAVVHLLD
ncbi:tyrosine-type recombinase/integrase [Ferrimonas balearica]|uniref:tyrosine-type recombinase/integrase n=1 Tax=Ferrimonas balearica TaxID=44012 RepID=UPI001C59511A|nr:site-specific integrase [Ferrimonas balearica]MBW3163693.1 site-specific integrase [Ferrimonas balearica]